MAKKNKKKIVSDGRIAVRVNPNFITLLLRYARTCDPMGIHSGKDQQDLSKQVMDGVNALDEPASVK